MKLRILIVDDQPLVRDLLARMLEAAGHEVEKHAEPDAALAALARDRFDVMFTDVVMPGLNGFELLRRVKSLHPELKVIVLTGYARDQKITDFLLHGADEYLAKPFQIHEIDAALQRVLGPTADA